MSLAVEPIVVDYSLQPSVGLSVGLCECLSSALWKNGGSDMDAVWDGRSDGSRDEAGSWIWGSVNGKGVILGVNLGCTIVINGDFVAYLCESA